MSTDSFAPATYPRITAAATAREIEYATERGYAAGHAEGMRVAALAAAEQRSRIDAENESLQRDRDRETTHAIALLEDAATALSRRYGELRAAAQAELERLAIELAEVVVHRELAAEEDSARNALHRVLSADDGHDVRAVRLHPSDVDALVRLRLVQTTVPLVADDSVAQGDAIATLDEGAIDGRLDAAFCRARAALRQEEP